MLVNVSKDSQSRMEAAIPTKTLSSSSRAASTSSPPPFESIQDAETSHLLLTPNDSDPPPFSLYDPEYQEKRNGDLISHDAHLNSDGEALYRFLLEHADTPPTFLLHIRGTHDESRTRHVSSRDRDGNISHRVERYDETIVDFDFYIDLTQHLLSNIPWSVADSQPAYRGRHRQQIESPKGRRRPNAKERKAYKRWLKDRDSHGLAPWDWEPSPDSGNGVAPTSTLRSSKTLRSWADEYCSSPNYLKEFVYEKVVYGWNFERLESAIRSSIAGGALYQGQLTVEFQRKGTNVIIRPDNRLSRMTSNAWLKFLLWILLIYPFILLYQYIAGARWEVVGGSFALKRLEKANEPDLLSPTPCNSGLYQSNDGNLMRVTGIREGAWLQKWQATITQAVHSHYQSSIPLQHTTGAHMRDLPLAMLDDL